ncbi:transglycosylase family protein [Streptomyces marincola]|nr:transglycosylase family protein [Streptomyces marincola]
MALPLLSAGSAQAVADETWDRAAECESGGLWSANTGNGYFGGLQLTLGMWQAYGGIEFASRPDLASRAQQIAVAERILADQGKAAFPSCGVMSGLWQEFREEAEEVDRAEEAEEAQVEEEFGGAEDSAATEPPAAGTDEGAAADDGTTGAAPPAPEEPAAGSAGSSGAGGEAEREPAGGGADAGREPGGGAAPGAPGGGAGGDRERPEAHAEGGRDERAGEQGGDTSRGGRHRGDPDPAEADRAGEAGGGRHADRHEVRRGDTLSAIAVEYGVTGGWQALHAANETVIGDDPDYILPGQLLDLGVTVR